MNQDNRWIKLADRIPWDEFEEKYARLFPSGTGNVAKPLRMALGALIIQTRFQYSDRELVDQIAENPYLQYFIGLPGFQEEAPFDASTLVLFRKRISAEMLMEANEYLLDHKDDDKDDPAPPSGEKNSNDDTAKEDTNKGTLTIDATCSPANIRYPQDVSLLNEAREKLENIIYRFCKCYSLKLPRRYRKRARKEYLAFAKSKKHTSKKIRSALRKQLAYVKRDLRYLEQFMSEGYAMTGKDINLYLTITRLYEQQQYMYDNRVHSVEHRIPDIIDEVVKAKVKVFAFSRYVPTGGEVDTSMTPQEYRKLLEICDAKFKAYEAAGCETYFNKKDHLWTLYEYETGQFQLPQNVKDGMIYGGCNCGNCHITIASNGDVMACRRVTDSRVANVFEDRLADVWICQIEKYREYDKFEKCSKCELKAWCRGCPAVANGTTGNFYGADPQCWKTRNEITGEELPCYMRGENKEWI